MAKKKRKKRPPAPRPTGPEDQGVDRQARKEQARREREARIKRGRRRQAMRRLVRWGAFLLSVALIVGLFWWQGASERRAREAAAQAAKAMNCTQVQEKQDRGKEHQPPFEYPDKPATSGNHDSSTLDPAVEVYDQPIDETLEPRAVHTLEHAYVIMYYQQDGANAPAPAVIDALAELAEAENKVILAPYYAMPEGRGLALVAWNRLQSCPKVTDPANAVTLAKGFIAQFRGGGEAPEPGQP